MREIENLEQCVSAEQSSEDETDCEDHESEEKFEEWMLLSRLCKNTGINDTDTTNEDVLYWQQKCSFFVNMLGELPAWINTQKNTFTLVQEGLTKSRKMR